VALAQQALVLRTRANQTARRGIYKEEAQARA